MKTRYLMTALLAIGIFASSGITLLAQGSITFTFGDGDRQAMREWYRDHYNASEFQGQRWNPQWDQRLQVGIVLAPDLRALARPAPQDLYRRLTPLQRGSRYVIVGDRLLVVDNRWLIQDINHFDRIDGPDQQVMRDWYRDHRDAPEFGGRQRSNDQLEQRIRVGAVLDPDLRRLARPVPADLLGRLPPRPRYLRYMIVGDHVCLIDNRWIVRDVLHFERQGNSENVPRDNYGNRGLQIVRAEYGVGDRTVDVTNRLNSLIQNGQLNFQVSNQIMGGDPFPGERKTLTITYTYDGRTDQATIYEGDPLDLPGPQGQGRPY